MNAGDTLPALQQLFATALSDIDGGDAGGAMQSRIRGDGRADTVRRFGVYAHAYRSRLVEALAADFPTLRALTGEADFARLASLYIDVHPSTTPSLRWFGRHFATFLHRAEPRRPLWAEIAAFEWAQGEVFDAPDAPVISLDAMADVPGERWPDMVLETIPALRRLSLRWNVATLVGAHGRAEKLPRAAERSASTHWLLWRRDFVIHWRPLSPDEASALDAVAAHASFGTLCERLCDHVDADTVAVHAAGLLKRWINDALVSAIEFAD